MSFDTSNNKRYYTLDHYYKETFNCKIAKISLNIGLSCPNIDGTKGYGGCIYCKNGSGDFAGSIADPLKVQFTKIKEVMQRKWPNAKFIAYFQAGTNTYGDLDYLKKNFLEVLSYENVVGINIATRCDAISDECLTFLEELNKKTFLTVELGLQTIHEKTAKLINRGHTLEEFTNMVQKLKDRQIKVVVHIINGLPYETKEMMLETAKFLNSLKVSGVKIHMLHILKDTALARLYEKRPFHLLTTEEYIDITTAQLEYLNKDIVIHRISGDPNVSELVAPFWLVKKFVVLNDIDKEMQRKDIYQGDKVEA